MATDEINDEYVANLLKKDAKIAAKNYKLVGLEAFNPKRCVTNLCCTFVPRA
jgi:hypothetical protein